ncbi:MAG TPA: ATP-binding protein [Acidobacteriota bacterium]|nr:ATP-binding protein [Acidobacteriota bacterium]
MAKRVLLAWSSGKDSAWALHVLGRREDCEVVGLLTTFNQEADRVSMHAVRRELVQAQAEAAGLPLWEVELPSPCCNEEYERRMGEAHQRAKAQGVTHMAFGDLFLEDIREYRIKMLSGSGIDPFFPIWCSARETPALAGRMLDAGLRAVITCVDPRQLDPGLAGRYYDQALLSELPSAVDPCGERGEFHTFCFAGPMFSHPIAVQPGEIVTREGFRFADVKAAERPARNQSSRSP